MIKYDPQRNFLDIVREEYLERVKRNSRYSIRAFAKSLEISSTMMSMLMNGKREASPEMISKIGLKIGLDLKSIELYSRKKSRSKQGERRTADRKFDQYTSFTIDTFEIISNWEHYAVLELITIKNFDKKWMARKLDLPVKKIEEVLKRLVRVNILKLRAQMYYSRVEDGFLTNLTPGETSSAQINLQKELLLKSLEALENIDFKYREHSSMTLTMDLSDFDEVRKRIKTFRRSLSNFLERKKKRTEVYQLLVSFFPLSNKDI